MKKLLLLLLLLSSGFIGNSFAVTSSDDLYTTICTEENLEGLQRVGKDWEATERPLIKYIITKQDESGGCSLGANKPYSSEITSSYPSENYDYIDGCYAVRDFKDKEYFAKTYKCEEQWLIEGNKLSKVTCQIGLGGFVFSPNKWFHKAQLHGEIDNWLSIDNLDTYQQDMLTVSVGMCSQL